MYIEYGRFFLDRSDFIDPKVEFPKGDAQVLFIIPDDPLIHYGIHDNDWLYEDQRDYPRLRRIHMDKIAGWIYFPALGK